MNGCGSVCHAESALYLLNPAVNVVTSRVALALTLYDIGFWILSAVSRIFPTICTTDYGGVRKIPHGEVIADGVISSRNGQPCHGCVSMSCRLGAIVSCAMTGNMNGFGDVCRTKEFRAFHGRGYGYVVRMSDALPQTLEPAVHGIVE